jgi:hypothetical protein
VSFSTTHQEFGFADGNAGHACTYSVGAPAVGDWDILCVNSDTVVSTPSGFTATLAEVGGQGAYVYTRKAVGGESASVTVTTTGNFDTSVDWVRLSGANAIDVTGKAAVNGSSGSSTPAFTSSALATATEYALAFAALHGGGVTPSNPIWGAGYTALAGNTQGTLGLAGYVGYKTPAGTAAESPTVSWTGTETDRYMLFVTFTTAAVTVNGTLNATLGGITAGIAGTRRVNGVPAATLGALTAAITGTTSGSATPTTVGAGWYKLLSIFVQQEDDVRFARDREVNPLACPHCGLVLRAGSEGSGVRLFCPAGDFQLR